MVAVGSAVTATHLLGSECHWDITLLAEGHWVQVQPLATLLPRLVALEKHRVPLGPLPLIQRVIVVAALTHMLV